MSHAAPPSPVFTPRSSWWVPPRAEQPELLDQGLGTPQDVASNLAEMAWANRTLGGLSELTRHVYPHLAASRGPITVLDLGTGAASVPAAIAQWARAEGIPVRIVALDRAARNLTIARVQVVTLPEISLVQADAVCLPLAPGSVDFVISSQFLHHLAPEQLINVLRTAYACARRGVVMSDLVRGWLPLIGFKLIQPFAARNFLSRHDGALSIRRAYTPGELRQLADAAGLHHAKITTNYLWRMTLVAEKD